MLRSTFKHLSGIGPKKEKQFWNAGILTWEDLYRHRKQLPLLPGIRSQEDNELADSWKAYQAGNTDFFAHKLPSYEYYRIALSYPNETLFLDIETTGLSWYYDHITLVGWSMGENYNVYIKGDDATELYEAFRSAKAIVTFNGTSFDFKFLYNEFPLLTPINAHIDLRHLTRRVGLKGGQKNIEKELNIIRNESIHDMEGENAPLLWYKFCAGETDALKKLIDYNYADVYGMKKILDEVINRINLQHEVPEEIYKTKTFFTINTKNNVKNLDNHINRIYENYTLNNGITINTLLQPFSHKIVGIDLTGSPEKASGWALLDGKHATTKQLLKDEDIIEKTLEAKPDLISIDSPLSLPSGRITVFNDDPGRKKFGIMRHCERILKKRGVNVYPCLIDSMQKLTKRGIELANKFRKLGIPVIESYPGAAQDIMKIPRKSASLEYLKKGLSNFGIKGDYKDQNVSHDELDAITSALVGHFFWSGRFERLGSLEEDYLIIPDLNVDATKWLQRRAIGLSGPIASGKTTAAKYLENFEFIYKRFSKTLSDMLIVNGINPSRKNLQEFGNQVNQEKGQRWLASKMLADLSDIDNVVIDGIRFPDDVAFMKEYFGAGFISVFITAPYEVRKYRYVNQGYTANEFEVAAHHYVERNVNDLKTLTHHNIENSGNLQDFQNNIIGLIQKKSVLCL
jgi:uncharacterized protein YprB with RNaseH-like and TPR domain/predicted nuclease with RNAse H fold/dephospho-CoA kinase